LTAIATRGSRLGAKAMNHTSLIFLPSCVSAVPVLPATWIPSIFAAVPVPRSTTASIMVRTCIADSFAMTLRWTSGSIFSVVRPSRSRMRSVKCGFISVPSLATVAATCAICIVVTLSLSWPIPMRPTSTKRLVAGSRRPLRYSPEALIAAAG